MWVVWQLGPLFLMGVTPFFIFVLWHISYHCEGDVVEFYKFMASDGEKAPRPTAACRPRPLQSPRVECDTSHTVARGGLFPAPQKLYGYDCFQSTKLFDVCPPDVNGGKGSLLPTPDAASWKIIFSYMAIGTWLLSPGRPLAVWGSVRPVDPSLPRFLTSLTSPLVMPSRFIPATAELAMMKLMPGKNFYATTSETGHTPVYKANGMQSFIGSLVLLMVLTSFQVIQPAVVYHKFGQMLMCMNIFALVFCTMLTFKGYYSPSSSDHGSTGNAIIDFYWGTELYPRILDWDIKTFTNCRFGMMFWAVGILCFAAAQYEDTGALSSSMFVCVSLQLIYIAKFFWWETGYWCSMDIQHDRAGYYICWGCLVWLPCVYTSQTVSRDPPPRGPGPRQE